MILSIDPGKTNLAFALLKVKNDYIKKGEFFRLREIESYEILWFSLWNLKFKTGKDGLNNNLSILYELLNEHPVIRKISKHPNTIKVCIEQQEGFSGNSRNNPGLLGQLTRLNGICGAIFGYFKMKGHEVCFVNKTCKWGWTSIKDLTGTNRNKRKKTICAFDEIILDREISK